MINHARTLLLNKAHRDNHISLDTAGEYVSPEFKPLPLPNAMRLLRRVLFGSKPDARFINLRVRELMNYVHQTELAEYVYNLDPRVTYWPMKTNDFFNTAKKTVNVTQLNGSPTKLTVVGNYQADNSVGRALFKYLITAGDNPPATPPDTLPLLGDGNTVMANIQELETIDPALVNVVGSPAGSTVSVLPHTDLKVIFDFAAPADSDVYAGIMTEINDFLLYELYDVSAGKLITDQRSEFIMFSSPEISRVLAQWLITVRAAPLSLITTAIPTLELLGEPVFLELFGLENKEPYATFRNLWFDHYSPVYRLAGLTMAAIYRTEELRRGS